jgi:hypothetical protein
MASLAPLIALLIVSGFMVVFVFFRFQPEVTTAGKSSLSIFNWTVTGVCAMLCAAWALGVRAQLLYTVDEHWIPQVQAAGALAIINFFYFMGFVLRNFWIFRPPKGPWRNGIFD